jgi:hypothetical protein
MMPIEFINALIVFQHLMNNDFHKYLDDFMVCSINNILIFPRTQRTMNSMYVFGQAQGSQHLHQI